jgi:hypothetical protein
MDWKPLRESSCIAFHWCMCLTVIAGVQSHVIEVAVKAPTVPVQIRVVGVADTYPPIPHAFLGCFFVRNTGARRRNRGYTA